MQTAFICESGSSGMTDKKTLRGRAIDHISNPKIDIWWQKKHT